MEEFCGSPLWDRDISWRDTNPELTPCFRKTVLVYIPFGFLWLFSFLDIRWQLRSRYRNIPWSFLNVTKFLVLIILISLSFAELAFFISLNDADLNLIYPAHFVASGIKIVTFIYVGFIMILHKIKGNHTSGLLFLFWLLLTFCSIFELLNVAREFGQPKIVEGFDINQLYVFHYIAYFTLISLMVILNCFADKLAKYSDFPKIGINPCPELFASFISNINYFWMGKMCYIGFFRPLTEKDLYDIKPADVCAETHPPWEENFQKSVAKNPKTVIKRGQSTIVTTNGSSLSSCIKTFGPIVLFSGLLRLIADLLLICCPLIMGLIITYIEEGQAQWKGFFLTFVIFFLQFLYPFFNGQQFHFSLIAGFNIRAALMSAIYRKGLRLSSLAKRSTTVGEIVNLMSVDANRFFELLLEFHCLWAGAVVIGMATWIVYSQYLGAAAFAGMTVALLTFPITVVIGGRLKVLQSEQMKYKDERIKIINEVLNGMKVLKLYAWEPSFEKLIGSIRDKEIAIMKRIAYLNAFTFFLFQLAPFLVAMASFMTYTLWMGGVLTTLKVFVPLALFNLMRLPMIFYPISVNFLMQVLVAMKRIDKYLNAPELDPNNVTTNPSEHAMFIKDGTFTWGGEEIILRNMNVTIKKNNVTAIVGPVGSGKTSLISAFLGEMEKLSGEVNIDGKIAYVSQQAWIQNATLRDNILFGLPYDKRKYEKVLHACALLPDLAILPGGDQTEIGEKGINLSGGQKQRVSVARAVYSGADIYLFDDPLSAVDSHVGKHIFNNVMSNDGMLKSKTRFLVTHALHFLPKVDEIYVMMNGEVTERGTYDELIERGGAFAEFLTHYLQEQGEEIEDESNATKERRQSLMNEHARRGSSGSVLSLLTGSLRNSIKSVNERRSIRRNGPDPVIKRIAEHARRMSEQKDLETKVINTTKLIEVEEAATGSVPWSLYFKYFQRMKLPISISSCIAFAIFLGVNVYSTIWLGRWANSERVSNETVYENVFYASVYGGLGGVQAFFLLYGAFGLAIGCLIVAKNLHRNLLSTIMRLPMWFFDTTPIGRLLNRFARDQDVIDNGLPIYIRNYVMSAFIIIAIFVVISIATPWFMAAAVPIIIIFWIVQKFYIETAVQCRRMESLTRSPIFAHFAESISGQSTIRAYGEQQRFIATSEERIDYNHGIAYNVMLANRWMYLNLQLTGSLVVLFSALMVVIGDVPSATAGLSLNYALQMALNMFFLMRTASEVETNLVAVERIEEYADKPQEAAWKTVDVNPQWPQKGVVIFKDFKVRYREGLDLVLKGISFETKPEEKIGIVGRTGAGKSSLTLSLFRIVEAAGGKIVIDGIEIAEIGLHSLRSRLTIIPQDPVLFSGSLRMNVDPFNAYSDEAIWLALENAHLKSFATSLTDGLNYKISEGGENLSVGQRQLVCLARALLRKTKVLILDEATAAIDFETDELIQKTIRTQFKDCTILTIAHRLNTIMDSDRIIVLDQGMIVEFDSPEVLLSNKNGVFYGMAKSAGLVDNKN